MRRELYAALQCTDMTKYRKSVRESNEFGNFDDKRRKLGDLLVYRPAAGSFFRICTTTVSYAFCLPFLSISLSCLLVSDKRKVQKHFKYSVTAKASKEDNEDTHK